MATLADLVTTVRQRTKLVGNTSFDDTEIAAYLNSSLAELHELLCNSFEDYAVTSVTFTLADAAKGVYSLPADFFKELRVDRSYSGNASANDWVRLGRINLRDESNYNQSSFRMLARPRVYGWVLCGAELHIAPADVAAGVYRLLYYPAWVDKTSGQDVAIGPAGQHWEEVAILDTCIKIAAAEQTDSSVYERQKAAALERIARAAANRSAGEAEPPPVADVPWYDRGDGWRGGSGGWL